MRRTTMMGWVLGLTVLGAVEAAAQDAGIEARQRAERQAVLEARGVRLAQVRAEQALVRARLQAVEQAARTQRAVRPPVPPRAVDAPAPPIPEAWLPQDPADSLYRAARDRLNARRYADAARLFAEMRAEYPRSGYTGDAYYFEALARSRAETQDELRAALELLAAQRSRHPQAATADDARALAVRIESQLARRGDARAAEAVMGAARGVGAGQSQCDPDDLELRATALSALLQMDPDRARPILQEVLRSRDACAAPLRAQAVFILSQHRGDDAATVDLLLDLAHRNPDPDPEVREAAVFWLSQSGREEAVDALVEILRSGNATPQVAEQAVFALGQTGNPRALEVLRDYATDASADRELRANAIFWLSQQSGADAAPFLRSLYGSLQDRELKERVLFAMAQTSWDGRLEWLTARALDTAENVELRKNALFWAGQAGLSPARALQIYRTAEDRELREQAIFVLTQVAEDGEAVDALLEIARNEEDRELREQAIFWLGQSDDPRVVELLMEIIRGGGGQ